MKRTVAFLAAVCVSTVVFHAAHSSAQTPPQTPPAQPADASGDTLRTHDQSPVAPAAPPAPVVAPKAPPAPAAAPDTLSNAARARRMRMSERRQELTYEFKLGLGSSHNYKSEDFHEHFSPSFGGMMSFDVRKYGASAGINLNYNFFLADGTVPNDLNIFTIFAELGYSPLKSKARPYVLVCGGYYRQWIVDLDYTENVLGYGAGAGMEMDIGKTRRLFLEGRYIEGQTREVQTNVNADKSNTVTIPVRLGVSWVFK